MEVQSRGRRWPRILVGVLVWPPLALLCLVASLLYHLDTDDGRWAVARSAGMIASELLVGELSIDGIDRLTLTGIEAHGITLRSAAGEEVARVGRLAVALDPAAFLRGEVHLPEVVVEAPWADLGPGAHDDSLALMDAVALVNPAPEEDPATEPIAIDVDHFRVVDASVSGLAEELFIRRGAIEGRSLHVEESVSVTVASTHLELDRGDAHLAALTRLEGEIDMSVGGRSEITLRAESSQHWIEADASMVWTEEGLGPMEAEVRLDLSPELARTLGADEIASAIDTPVRGTIAARGTIDDADVEIELSTDGGRLALALHRDGELATLRAVTDGLRLGEIIPALGEVGAGGEVEASVSPISGPERRVEIALRDVRYDEWSLAEARVRATVSDEAVTIEEVALPHLAEGGHLDVQGTITTDGAVDVRVDARIPQIAADPNVRRLAPGVRTGLTVDVRAQITSGDDPTIDVSGRVRADRFRAPGVSARRLNVRGSVRGHLDAPVVDLAVAGGGIRASDVTIRDTALTVRGGPRHYQAEGRVVLAGGERFDLDASAEIRGGEYLADATVLVRGVWPEPVRVVLRRMHLVPERQVSFESLSAESDGLSLGASGRYSFRADSDLRAEITTLDLDRLGQALSMPILTGSAAGRLSFGGTTREPEIAVLAQLSDITAGPFEFPALGVEAALSSDRGELSAEVHADAAGYGRIDLASQGTLGEGRDVEARLVSGAYQADLALHEVPAAVLSLASPDLPPFDGMLEAEASLNGTLAAPSIALHVHADDFAGPGINPLAIDVRAGYEEGSAELSASASDAAGVLVSAHGTSAVDLPALLTGAPFDPLETDLALDVSVPSRRLDALPAPLTVPIPLRASAELAVRRSEGQTTIRLDGHVDRFEDAIAADGCEPGPVPTLGYRLDTREGRTTLAVRGNVGGVSVGTIDVEAETPIDAWIRDGFPEAPPALAFDATVEGLDLARVPVLCSTASGALTLHARGTDLLRPSPRVELEGSVADLSVAGSVPVQVQVSGGLDLPDATVALTMRDAGRDILVLSANAPVTLGEDGMSPALLDETLTAELRVDRAPAAPILGAIPILAQPRGVLDGDLSARIRGDDFVVDGELTFDDVGFIVTEPLIRIDRLNGAVGFERGAVLLRDLRMRDREGRLRIDGRVAMAGLDPERIELTIDTDDWPIRNEGVPFAYIDSEVGIEGTLSGGERREVRATLDEMSIRLPEETGYTVLDLSQHPDVIYEDQPGFDAAQVEQVSGSDRGAPERALPTRILVDAREPFWIRRDDFSIQLTADLRIDIEGSEVRITGPVGVKRGFLSLVGRSFDLQDGEIIFDGGKQIDPTLSLSAVHTLQSRETVTVKIEGRLSAPQISFSTSVAGVRTEAEIIELLVTGHGGSADDARNQAISIIGGIMTDFISSMTRRSAGQYIPRLSIESGAGGGARVRAGLAADALIPDFLDDYIRSAYVEGFVGSGAEEESSGGTTQTGVTGGFLIELYWPRSIVTTGTYEQPSNWSLDVTWQP